LVFAHCIDPISLNRIQKFLCRIDGEYVGIGEVKTSVLRRDLDMLTESERAIPLMEKEMFRRVLKLYPINPSLLFYDLTSIYFNGSSCKLAKPGQNSQHLRKPQINVGLVVTQEGGFPVFHRVFDGNEADVRTLEDAARCLYEMGIERCTLLMDRGFCSEKNLIRAGELGFEVIAGMPLKRGMRQKAIDAIEHLAKVQNRVMFKSGYLYVREMEGEVRQFICLNDKERVSIREAGYREIDDAIRLLGEGKAIKSGLKKYITKENGSLVPNQKVIEKAFRTLKSVLSIEPVRSWLKGQVKAHLFVCYLAYLIFSVIEWKIAQAKLDLSATNILEELESAYKVALSDPIAERRWDKIATFSKKQESILKALGYKDV
jgi:transposase